MKSKKMKPITQEEYNQLVPYMILYRESLMESVKIKKGRYRLYTEKRSYGGRTKFWLSGNSFPVKKVSTLIKSRDTFMIGINEYMVSLKSSGGGGGLYGSDYQLVFTKI